LDKASPWLIDGFRHKKSAYTASKHVLSVKRLPWQNNPPSIGGLYEFTINKTQVKVKGNLGKKSI
jgi:hypothetical protein